MNNRFPPIFSSRSSHAARAIGMAAMLCAPCMFAPATWSAEQTVVAPPQYANREGDSEFRDVFNNSYPTVRYQQIFDAPAFQTASQDIIEISGIRFRLNGGGVGSFDVVVPKIEIRLSTSARDSLHMSEVFEENVGLDETVVFPEGLLRLSGTGVGLAPQPFNVEVRFEQSFWYDPRAGHLLIEILRPVEGIRGFPSLDRAYLGTGSAIGGYNGDRAAILKRDEGMVTQFLFNQVPEPTTLGLLFVGGLLLWLRGKCR